MKQNINDELTKMIKPILYRPYNNTKHKVLRGNKRNIPIAKRRKRKGFNPTIFSIIFI